MDANPIKSTPILCLDVWENVYYLKYKKRRLDYINAFGSVVNCDKVAKLGSLKNTKQIINKPIVSTIKPKA